MYRTDFGTLWEKARVRCFERTASKHVYYQGWNRSPAQVGCKRKVLLAGALGRPRGIGWRGRWEGGLGWGIHVNLWLIHANVWQKLLQYCKVISLQLIKINGKKRGGMRQCIVLVPWSKCAWSPPCHKHSSSIHFLLPIFYLCWNQCDSGHAIQIHRKS